MENEKSLENVGLQPNPVLKAPKQRLPLQELNNVIQFEDENTDMMQARKRRVSFANVNIIKEFNAGAESLLVCHTPAYEEPFSACSDSSNPSAHETYTPAKSTDCEDMGNNAVAPNHLSFSNYNKYTSTDNSKVSLGPDQIGSQDMDCTDFLKTAYLSANTNDMEITAALHSAISASRLSLNSSKMTKTKYYNSMELTDAIRSSVIEGTKLTNNTSFSEMEFTQVLDPALYESAGTIGNSALNGMDLTKAISPLLMETTKQSICNISAVRRRSSRFVPGNGRRSVYNMSENGMEFTEVIQHHRMFESGRTPNNLTENGMELTETIFPLLQEGSVPMDTTAESGMELTEVLSPELCEVSKNMSNITDTGMELTNAVVQGCSERTRTGSNVTSSRMELSEGIHQQCQNRNRTVNNFSQSGMELTNGTVPVLSERTRSVSNVTSSRMELTEGVHQPYQNRNKTVNNFSQSGMELTNGAVPVLSERTSSVSNVTSSRMELTEGVHQPYQNRNKTVNNFSQSGMELTNGAVPVLSERTRSVSNVTSSRTELTEGVHQPYQNRNTTVNNFSQSGIELTNGAVPEGIHQQFQETNKTVNSSSQCGMELTGPLHFKLCNEAETKSRMTQSAIESTIPTLSKFGTITQTGNSHMIGLELTDIIVPKLQETTNLTLLNNMTSSGMEFTQAALQRQQKQNKSATSLTQTRMELTGSELNGTPYTRTDSIHSNLSAYNTSNIENNINTEMEIANKIAVDNGQNSKALNSSDAYQMQLTQQPFSHKENENYNNLVHNKVYTVIPECKEKSSAWKIETEVLTDTDFPEKLMNITSDKIIKECTGRGLSETDFKNMKNSLKEEIVADCTDPEVKRKEETKNNLINRIMEKSNDSVNISINNSIDDKTKEVKINENVTESIKNDSLSLCIDRADKKETREKELSCADLVKLNETVHIQSKNKYVSEDHSVLSCADQNEHFNIGSCSRIEITGVTPLDDDCNENNIVERNIVNVRGMGTLNTERDICSSNSSVIVAAGYSELCEENANTINTKGEVVMNIANQIGNNKCTENSIKSMVESNSHNSDVEMDMDKINCISSSNEEEEEDIKNKTKSTSITKSCKVIYDKKDYVNDDRRSLENDNLKNEIIFAEENRREEVDKPIVNSTMNKKSIHNTSHDDVISQGCQEVHTGSPKRSSFLNSAHSTVEPAGNTEAMEVGDDDLATNFSRNNVYLDSVSAHNEVSSSNADSKSEDELHKSPSNTHSASGSVKIKNRTEISTLGSKRKYAALENMGTADGSNNPPKICIKEQVRSNFDKNVINDMQVIVKADDDKESANNKEIFTHCTVEIGSPRSNKNNVSCLESNKKENSMLSNTGILNDEDDKHDANNTAQTNVADISVQENIMRSDFNDNLFQSLADHSNITFRRKSKSSISLKNDRSRINNQPSSAVDFQNNIVSHSINVVVSTEITMTNVTMSDVNACSTFIQDKRKSNVDCKKSPLPPLAESTKESNNVQEKKVYDSNINQASNTGDHTQFKTTVLDRNLICDHNHVQENTNKVQDLVNHQSSQMRSNVVSALQQIPRDFREKWNLYEVSHDVWSLDLIQDILLVIFKIDEHTKDNDDTDIVKIMYKEIYAGSEDSVKRYVAKTVIRKFSTRVLKKICSKSSKIPCMIEHVNAFVQRTIEFRKYLQVLLDIYCAVLDDNRMLTFEVCSPRSRLWVKIYVNLESFEYLSAADITVANIQGNVEQSVIRKIFDTVKNRQNALYEFVTKVNHYIRIERSLKPVTQ